MTGERGAQNGGDADRVLVDLWLHVLGLDRVSGWSGMMRGSTSKLLPHDVYVTAEIRFGRVVSLPAFSRRWRHFHFKDSAPSMIASDDPWVRAPVVSPGAWKRLASMRMQRCSISAVCGYSA